MPLLRKETPVAPVGSATSPVSGVCAPNDEMSRRPLLAELLLKTEESRWNARAPAPARTPPNRLKESFVPLSEVELEAAAYNGMARRADASLRARDSEEILKLFVNGLLLAIRAGSFF